MSQVHAVRRNPFSRLLGEAGIAFLCGLIFSGAEIGSLPSPLPLAIAGCLSSTGAIAVLIGTLLRYLMSDLLLERLPLLFALLLITCARLFSFGCIFIALHGRLYAVQWHFIVFFDEWNCTGFFAIRNDSVPNGYNCMVFTYSFAGIAKSTENSAEICNRLCSCHCLYSLHCCVDLF